jgi:hypothetical protein
MVKLAEAVSEVGMLSHTAIAVALFITGLGYLNVLDIRRLRVRARILAIADPTSEVYQRNLPRKTTWHDWDNEVLDRWSERVFGLRWGWRALHCIALGALMAAAALHFRLHAQPVFLLLSGLWWPIFMWHGIMRSTKEDLAIAEMHRAQSVLSNRP